MAGRVTRRIAVWFALRLDLEPVETIPGAPGAESFTFRATSTGTTVVHFVYSQPWDGGTRGAWSVDLTVTVR